MKTYVRINANRDGYYPEQLDRSMTVRELIDLLSCYDEDLEVILSHDNGYTYGSINSWDVRQWDYYEDEDEDEDDEEEYD